MFRWRATFIITFGKDISSLLKLLWFNNLAKEYLQYSNIGDSNMENVSHFFLGRNKVVSK